MKNALIILAAGGMALMLVSPCQSANSILYGDFASWSAAVGGSYISQDFEGYVHLTDLNGVDVLSGVNFTSNMTNVVAWQGAGDTELFAFDDITREQEIAYYDINLTLPYYAVAFDVDSWNPLEQPGQSTAEIFFADLTSISVGYYQTGPTEDTPVFFGIASDTAITKIRWHEGLETDGGNEEVAFDHLAVSRISIPEPSMISAFGVLLLLGAGRSLRRKT